MNNNGNKPPKMPDNKAGSMPVQENSNPPKKSCQPMNSAG